MEFYGQNLTDDELVGLDAWMREERGQPFWKLLAGIERDAVGLAMKWVDVETTTRARARYEQSRYLLSLPKEVREQAVALSKK